MFKKILLGIMALSVAVFAENLKVATKRNTNKTTTTKKSTVKKTTTKKKTTKNKENK